MTDEKDPKVEALAEVARASEQHTQAIDNEVATRDAHHEAIVKALRAGAGPSAIERVSRYDRQHIDRIRRAAGIPSKRQPTVRSMRKEDPK
ncbi:hypothetical protein [Micromonospora carbonacea]|uniref:hypothetical protein n=1 Tax=Micromonospora carbonacea TaxID=47853 RepID=UPI00371F4B62